MSSLGTIWAELGLKLTKFDEGLRNAEAKIKQAEEKLEGLQRASERLSDAGKKLTLGITVPLVGIGTAAFKMSNDFNAAMANVATLIPGNTERVNELKGSVQDMAIEVGKRTGDIAGGLYQVISAFGDTADTVKILETNAKAATAGIATTTDAINLTSAVTKGYGDKTAEAVKKASDLAFQTVKLGQTTFPELAASIGNVVPLANSMGLSLEELFGVMATLTGATGNASIVTTQLRSALTDLQDPSKEMREALRTMGFDSGTAALKVLGLQGTLDGLKQAVGGNEEAFMSLFGRVEAKVGVIALTGEQSEELTNKIKAMEEAAGAMEEAFEEQTNGINKAGFAWEQFKVKLEVAAERLGEKLAPTFSKILDYIKKVVDWFTDLDDSTQDLIIKFGMAAAAIGPFLLILGKLGSSIVALSAAKAALTGSLIAGTTATTAATGAATGLSMASVVLLGKIALVAGGLYLFYEATKDAKKGADSVGAASGILGYNMQNLKNDIENTTYALSEQRKELQKTLEVVQGYTDTVEAQRLKSAVALQEQQGAMSEQKKWMETWLEGLGNSLSDFGNKAVDAGQKVQDALNTALESLSLKAQIAQAQFDLLKSKMGENAKESELLGAQVESLQAQYEAQTEKLTTLHNAYDQMKAIKGENAVETQRLYLEMLQEQKVMQDLQNEIDKTRDSYDKLKSSVPSINTGSSPRSVVSYYAVKAFNEGRASAQDLIDAISNTPKLAKGGTISSSGSVIVGDAGPEILDLPSGARVTPLDRTGVIDYDRLGQAVAKYIKPSVTLNTTINSPEPVTPSVAKRKQEQLLRQLAMEWGV